jgi:hypothetical protein
MIGSITISLQPYGLRNHALIISDVSSDRLDLVHAAALGALEQLSPSLERLARSSLDKRKECIRSTCEASIRFFGPEARVAVQEAGLSEEEEETVAADYSLAIAQDARRLEQDLRAALPQPAPEDPQELRQGWLSALSKVLLGLYRLPSSQRDRKTAILIDVFRRSAPIDMPAEDPIWQVPTLLPFLVRHPHPLKLTKASDEQLRHATLAPCVVWAARRVAAGSDPTHEDLSRIETSLLCSRQDALKLIALVLHAQGANLPAVDQKRGFGQQLRLFLEDLQRPTPSDAGLKHLGAFFDGEPTKIKSALLAVAHGFEPLQPGSTFLTLRLQLLERHVQQLQRDWSELNPELLEMPLAVDATAQIHALADHVSVTAEESAQLDELADRLGELDRELRSGSSAPVLDNVTNALVSTMALPGRHLFRQAIETAARHLETSKASVDALQPESDQRSPWVKALLAIFSLGIATLVSRLIRYIPYRREKARLEALVRSDLDQLQRMTKRLQSAVHDWKAATSGRNRAPIEKAARALTEISEEIRGLSYEVGSANRDLVPRELERSIMDTVIQADPSGMVETLQATFEAMDNEALGHRASWSAQENQAFFQRYIDILQLISELPESSYHRFVDASSSSRIRRLAQIPRLEDPEDPGEIARLRRSLTGVAQHISPSFNEFMSGEMNRHSLTTLMPALEQVVIDGDAPDFNLAREKAKETMNQAARPLDSNLLLQTFSEKQSYEGVGLCCSAAECYKNGVMERSGSPDDVQHQVIADLNRSQVIVLEGNRSKTFLGNEQYSREIANQALEYIKKKVAETFGEPEATATSLQLLGIATQASGTPGCGGIIYLCGLLPEEEGLTPVHLTDANESKKTVMEMKLDDSGLDCTYSIPYKLLSSKDLESPKGQVLVTTQFRILWQDLGLLFIRDQNRLDLAKVRGTFTVEPLIPEDASSAGRASSSSSS